MGELIWRRARTQNKIEAGKVRRTVATSLSAATLRMVDGNRLQRDTRHLESFDELQRVYPARTMRVDLHEMRTALLPKLLDLAARHPEMLPPQRALHEHAEAHAVSKLRERDPEGFAEACQKWEALDLELCQLLGDSTGHDRLVLKRTLAAAWMHFEPNVGAHATSMLTDILRARQTTAPPVRDALGRVSAFFDEHVGNRGLQAAALKRKLYQLAEFRQGHATGLLPSSARLLLAHPPAYLQNMPGYRPPGRIKVHLNPWDDWPKEQVPELLWRLVERDALQPFHFFSLS